MYMETQMTKKNNSELHDTKVASSIRTDRSLSLSEAPQKLLEWTLAAAMAWRQIERELQVMRKEKDGAAELKAFEAPTRKTWREYFSNKGVVFAADGSPAFPVGACGDLDPEDLMANVITMAKDFFEYLNFDSDGEHVGECLSQCFEIAFRFGLTSGGSFGDPSKCHVSVMMNLELKEKKLSLPNGIRDLEHLARTQRPKMLARWEASRATEAARAELKRCEAAESLAELDLAGGTDRISTVRELARR